MFKVNHKRTELRHLHRSGVFIANLEHISYIPVFLLLILKK